MWNFFTGTHGSRTIGEFGILPLVNATLMTTFIAMLIALPLGLSVAIYLSEYASPRARSLLKPILEVLAGIPTVVYGYFALTFMTPLLRIIFGNDMVEIYNIGLRRPGDGHPDPAADRFDDRRRPAAPCRAPCARPPTAWAPPSWKWPSRSSFPAAISGICRGGHRGHLACHRRDDDRRHGRRRRSKLHLQSLSAAQKP